MMPAGTELSFDAGYGALGLITAAMRNQPTRRFRQPQAHEPDHQPEQSADEERQAPSQVYGKESGIEQHERSGRTQSRADPEAAVDDQIGPAAVARRHQLLNGGINGGVFAADPRSGKETKDGKAQQIPRQGSGRRRKKVERKRNEEQFLAPESVGEPAKEERAQHAAGEIG